MLRIGPALAVAAALCPAAPVAARDGDVRLSAADVRALTDDATLTFYDDGRSRYYPDGRYTYTYAEAFGGGTAHGVYEVRDDGRVCVRFVNGFGRCDSFVRAGGRIVLIDAHGDRYPVRP